jgi:hypothetical protein
MDHKIEVDDQVFGYLQSHARPFLDTPNSTLRRLLGLDEALVVQGELRSVTGVDNDFQELNSYLEEQKAKASNKARRAPKADLSVLVANGKLRNGDLLDLVDYSGNVVAGRQAIVEGQKLRYQEKLYAMSPLAEQLLKGVGYESDEVRGPSHWARRDGVTVKVLWEQHLKHSEK